jgi:predicted RNA methylase
VIGLNVCGSYATYTLLLPLLLLLSLPLHGCFLHLPCDVQGMLAIGAALLGSPCVIGLDVDADALEVAQDNCEQFEDPLPVSADVGMCVA